MLDNSLVDRTKIKPYEQIDLKVYGYSLPQVPSHQGLMKVGETNREVEKRISEQVGTIGLDPKIHFQRKAKKADGKWFHDRDLHRFFILNDIQRHSFGNSAEEWFDFKGRYEEAITLTDKFINNDYDEIQTSSEEYDYILREEQQKAVDKTLGYYQSKTTNREFLWNAKPRFGKTLTTYDFVRKIKGNNILIVTNRPAIANSWYEDFMKFISWQEPNIKFVSETDALKNKAMTRKDYLNFLNSTDMKNPAQIYFVSLQDLKGAKFAGGRYKKLEWISNLKWDLLVIDEAHEGIDTIKTDYALRNIKSEFILHLSGTPFKALANNKFNEKQIYSWSYVDEQEAKDKWDYTNGTNPYENLPTLSMFTYQMSKLVEEQLSDGLTLSDNNNIDYAFDLNEFFKVKDNSRFEYEDSVKMFLDNLSSGKYPFSTDKHRNELDHTFWVLPRVNSAKALEKLLKNHDVFKEYKIVLAAGDGISLNSDLEEKVDDFKSNEKSYDRVKKAIRENEKTITLSVGQLTTGVTIPEWSAVLMLNNIKSPSLYFQAAFRAQNPYEFKRGDDLFRKENAYIFDFAPERTLNLYDDLANNLVGSKGKTTKQRKKRVKELLNFFPVIGEDENGEMHELNASEVLTIPKRITSKEVVKRGFMSNLLFSNVSGIFSENSPFKEILDKIPPEKQKKLKDNKEIEVTDPLIDGDGNIDIPEEIVINEKKGIFGDKIFRLVDEKVDGDKVNLEINKFLDERFDKLKDSYNINKSKGDKLNQEIKSSIHEIIQESESGYLQSKKDTTQSYSKEILQAKKENNQEKKIKLENELKVAEENIRKEFEDDINERVSNVFQEVIKKEITKTEEKKVKKTEDDVRDHLRGFSRTIPSFLMAYGTKETKLSNFDNNIDEETFLELTSISLEEFRILRDGFEYTDSNGNNNYIAGVFNEVVFNASILEFLQTKQRLSNYFDETFSDDIFDYIPPQKTNQIFTPRGTVEFMLDILEEYNPDIFSNKQIKFADLYVKSGLYITEIVKRLYQGLKDEIPDSKERLKWIFENQVYACSPSNIIYNISKNFIFNGMDGISSKNLLELDTLKLVYNQKLSDDIYKIFGDENMKFDVIIGNPPFQEEKKGRNRDDAIYHLFLDEVYKISEKAVMITPARFLFNVGSTPKWWNEKMLNDKHLTVAMYERVSDKIFPNTSIIGGIAVTYRDSSKILGPIDVFTSYPELNSILSKVELYNRNSDDFGSLMYVQNKFDLKSLFKDYPEFKVRLGGNGKERRLTSSIFKVLPEIFSDIKSQQFDFPIYGRAKNKRTFKYTSKKYIENHSNMDKWKVFVPAANGASGTLGDKPARIISYPILGEPNTGHTQTFISIGSFNTKFEGESLLKYIKTKFARTMLGVLKVTQNNKTPETWSKVPVLDFTKDSDIDWTKNISEIDKQIYEKFNLTREEILFIENHIVYLD